MKSRHPGRARRHQTKNSRQNQAAKIEDQVLIEGTARARRSAAIMALLICSLLVFVVAILAVYELNHGSKGRALAIVIGKDVQARLATADTANSVLALPPGSEVKILSTRGDWVYAALPNNLRGWIPAKDAELVRLSSRS